NRTFVSALGNDGNPCTLTQPCRTLQIAFNATAPGGEIEVLDPTGYGTLAITHAISIQGHGWASMNGVPGGAIIQVTAGPGDRLTLHGLITEGFGTAGTGVSFLSGGSLVLEDSVIQNINGTGLFVAPNGSGLVTVSVSHTRLTGSSNGNARVDATAIS